MNQFERQRLLLCSFITFFFSEIRLTGCLEPFLKIAVFKEMRKDDYL